MVDSRQFTDRDLSTLDCELSTAAWGRMSRGVEEAVRDAVLTFVHRGEAFRPVDVAHGAGDLVGVPLERIARIVRRLYDDGLLRPFGYRRTLGQERTRHGVVTSVLYAPPQRPASEVPAPSKAPTRAPHARPFGYLGLDAAGARQLGRQTAALKEAITASGEERVRMGELLIAVEALVGPSGLSRYATRELGISVDSARRWIQAARLLKKHAQLAQIAWPRPTILYELAEPSFPGELLDAILQERGLVVSGEPRRIEQLRVRDLRRAKQAFLERTMQVRALESASTSASRAGDDKELLRLRAELGRIRAISPTQVDAPSVPSRRAELVERTRRLVSEAEELEPQGRTELAGVLRALLERLERKE
jgi:hypothetical protein